MSIKKESEVLVMAESLIPSDLTTPTLGSNYCLEGFEDMAYGVGVLEGVLDPRFTESPALPTGLSKDGAEGMCLTAYMNEEPIVNHEWLSEVVQDPDRLPERPVSIPELEEAWGKNNWASATPHFDQDRRSSPVKAASRINLEEIARRAMRRSATGHSFAEIEREAILSAGGDRSKVARILDTIQEEHGLAGKVFIRSAAYPGYSSDKWKDHLKKLSSAQYVVVSPEELRNASWIQDGRCIVTGKKAVLEVPWAEAAFYYLPRLKAAGYSVSGVTEAPRALLQSVLLSTPKRKLGNVANLPKHSGDVSRLGAEHISSQKARAAFEGRVARETLNKIARVEKQIAKGLRGDLLRNFIASTFTPSEQKHAAGFLFSVLEGGDLLDNPVSVKNAYVDTGLRPNQPKTSGEDPEFNSRVKQAAQWALQSAPSLDNILKRVSEKFGLDIARKVAGLSSIKNLQRVASIVEGVNTKIAQGARGDLLRSIITRSFKPSDMKLATRLLAPVLMKTGALNNEFVKRSYVDTGLRLNRPQAPVADEAFEDKIKEALKWATSNVSLYLDLRSSLRKNFSEDIVRKVVAKKAFLDLESAQSSVQKVSSEISRGSRGDLLRSFIAKTIRPEHQKLASKMLIDSLNPEFLDNTPTDTKKYAGVEFRHNVPSAQVKTASANDARQAVLYVKRAMNEGYAGERLDQLIEKRFAYETLKEAVEEIRLVREAHEGVAGFMYVDGQTYASQNGTTGCDKGALKHRANQLKMILAMPRCATCALARSLPDGTMKCGTYNKVLVSSSDLSSDDIQISKQANIKGASQSDIDATASMFAPAWKNDFQLHNAALDDIQALPDDEKVASIITFGSGLSW